MTKTTQAKLTQTKSTQPGNLIQPENTFWHFAAEDRRLGYGDGREIMAGQTLTVHDQPVMCQHGLHASRRAIDALDYAPGPVACLVTLGGEVLHDTDKSAGQERTALWVFDSSRLLREFACDVAETGLLNERTAGREPDPRTFAAIEVTRRFMRGEATEGERAAASAAAWNAFNDRLTQMLLAAYVAEGEALGTQH